MADETSLATQGQGNATPSQDGAQAIIECIYIIVYSGVLHTHTHFHSVVQ